MNWLSEYTCVGIECLKTKHDVTKLDLHILCSFEMTYGES